MSKIKKFLCGVLTIIMCFSGVVACTDKNPKDGTISYDGVVFPEDFNHDYLIKKESDYHYDETDYAKRALIMAEKIQKVYNHPELTAPGRLTWRTGYYLEKNNEPNQWAYGALQTMALTTFAANPNSQLAKDMLIDVCDQIDLFRIKARTHETLDFSMLEKDIPDNYLSNDMIDMVKRYFDLDEGDTQARVSIYSATTGGNDPYYDDNVWCVMALLDAGILLNEAKYIQAAELNMGYVFSGWNFNAGGGITWKEGQPSKNTCINGPAILACTMFYDYYNSDLAPGTTEEKEFKKAFYLGFADAIYRWTYDNLRDTVDGTYYDNIKYGYGGVITNREEYKLAYGTGTVISSSARLYRIYKELGNEEMAEAYKKDTIQSTEGSYLQFITRNRAFAPDLDIWPEFSWFNVYLVKAYLDVYEILDDARYIERVQKTMDFAWKNARDYYGFIKDDWTGRKDTDKLNYSGVELIQISAATEVMAFCGVYQNLKK